MNRYLKIILIGLLSLAALLALGSGIVSHFFQDEVIGFVIESINKQVSSRIQVRSAHFSVFRKFPNAAVEFKHVVMDSARDFDTLSFDPAHSRQLLVAESVFAELNLFRLLTGDYRITRIEVRDGNINMLTDKSGKHNFIFWKIPGKSTGDSSPIELQNVALRNVEVYYSHKRSNTVIALHANRSRLSGRFSSRQYSLSADWQGTVRLLSVDDDVFIRDKALELTGKLDADNNVFTIRQSDLTLAKVEMTVSGGFTTGDDVELDLHVEGRQMDYASLVSVIPDPYGQNLHDHSGKGDVNFAADITGKAGGGNMPHIEAQFGMAQGQITHRQSKVKLTGLSFTGSFSTGEKSRRSTSVLHIRDFACSIGGGTIKGQLSMQNFVQPQITIKIAGNTDWGQLYRFIPGKRIASAGGRINCDLTVNARLKHLLLAKTSDIDRLELQGAIKLSNASVHLREPAYRFSRINGSLQFGNRVAVNSLTLMLNGNDFKIDGYMERLSPYLLKQSKTVYLKANISSQQVCIDSLLVSGPATTGKTAAVASQQAGNTASLLLPAGIDLDAGIEAAKFRYRKFEAEDMKARLVYQPRILEIRSIDFSSMSGKVTGSGTIANNGANMIHVLGETTLNRVEVKQLFRAFDNFGQDVLRAEHVKGSLSGDLGFAIGWNSRMQLRQEEITVESQMDLDGGELVNFEPLNNLSRFVALEELQNIRFSKLRTRVSIRNRQLMFPQTDIQTSAFDIQGSGEHNFDNSYTYRVKILLSELLAAKARKAKRENRENEYSENGGKRTALYLKIAGQGDDFKISYDKQSAKASVAEDIRNEKQNLKTILKEEFGWFRNDTSLVKPTTPENTGKLRFTFDEETRQQEKTSGNNRNSKKKSQPKDENDEEKIKIDWE
ncbi:MAG: AsmA-like C-terminal region-containing protein [Bacteroidales bacterium]|jgi:hypothetical protein|nr:AsmA-like C-terminal region-containing protein [Bacteroidales bacterium]